MARPKVVVSDHALVRYLERCHEIDLQVIRDHIASQCLGAICVGATSFYNGFGTFAFDGAKVTTFVAGRHSSGPTFHKRAVRDKGGER